MKIAGATAVLYFERLIRSCRETGTQCEGVDLRKAPTGAGALQIAEAMRMPYQRSKEFMRDGSALAEAGALVLSTMTLVPTRARL
jgi:hypothetical protein